MKKVLVESLTDYIHEIPATQLQTLDFAGNVLQSIDVPAKRYDYPAGSVHAFSGKARAKEFIKAHAKLGGAFRIVD